jgi:hypothetical protein
MTDLFLGEDLLSPSKRETKAAFPLGLPDGDYIERGELSEERRALARQLMKKEEGMYGVQPGSYFYCYVFYNLLISAAFDPSHGPHMSSIHDGRGYPRTNSLAIAARAKALQLWFDPMVRESCGDAMAPAPSFAHSVLTCAMTPARIVWRHDGTIAPGPSDMQGERVRERPREEDHAMDELLAAAVGKIEDGGAASSHARKIVRSVLALQRRNITRPSLGEPPRTAWSHVCTTRRARLAFTLTKALEYSEQLNEGMFGAAEEAIDCDIAELLEGVEGLHGTIRFDDSSTRWAVWEVAATGHVGREGHQDLIKAFYCHVQRRCMRKVEVALRVALNGSPLWPLPEDIVTKICAMACDPSATNMSLVLKEWKTFAWPSSLTPTDGELVCAGANEKLLCCKLVMDPNMYADWEGHFGKKPVNS